MRPCFDSAFWGLKITLYLLFSLTVRASHPSPKTSLPMLRMPVCLGIILALSVLPSRPFRWGRMRRTLQVSLGVLGLLGAKEHSAWSPGKEGAAGGDPLLMSLS